MNKYTIVLISEREEDIQFVKKISDKWGSPLAKVTNVKQLDSLIQKIVHLIVFIDLDHEPFWDPINPLYIPTIQNHLKSIHFEQNTFYLTSQYLAFDEKLKKFQNLFKGVLQQSILRPYEDSWVDLISQSILFSFNAPYTQGLQYFFPEDVKIQKIEIKNSLHKLVAADAVGNVLKKHGVNSRVSEKISNAVDEFIMNALFDAPKSPLGVSLRENFNRKARFDLDEKEVIELSLVAHNGIIGICVSDIFGSVEKERFISLLRQDFTNVDYKPKAYSVGAGLGLYGVVQSGVSFLISCKQRNRTQAFVFAPIVKSFKDFNKSIRFSFSYFSK